MRLFWSARLVGTTCALAMLLVSCASPPLMLYTLADAQADPDTPTYGPHPLVIQIERVGIPDELDSEDLLIQDGSRLHRSSKGRWATRLSLEITNMLTQHLAAQRPDALVTDRRQSDQPAYRISINITRFSVTPQGIGRVSAVWQLMPSDTAIALTRHHAQISEDGPVTSDAQVVALERFLLIKLAAAIDLAELR